MISYLGKTIVKYTLRLSAARFEGGLSGEVGPSQTGFFRMRAFWVEDHVRQEIGPTYGMLKTFVRLICLPDWLFQRETEEKKSRKELANRFAYEVGEGPYYLKQRTLGRIVIRGTPFTFSKQGPWTLSDKILDRKFCVQ